MKNLLPSGLAFILLLALFYQCQTSAQLSTIPPAVASFIHTLPQDARPIKSITDQRNGKFYWLSFVGNLYSIGLDGNQHRRINQGVEAWKDVTFIEDFCVNKAQDKLYFTDLMDLETGQSAIKVMDMEGKNVEVIAYLSQEIPYHISFSENVKMLFFLSKSDTKRSPQFRLRFLDLARGTKGTLHSSLSRIDSLYFDAASEEVRIYNAHQDQFAFSTDLQDMNGLAEAFKQP